MTTWEYKIFSSQDVPGRGLFSLQKDRATLEAYLNELGREGWEIVDVDFTPAQDSFFTGLAKRARR